MFLDKVCGLFKFESHHDGKDTTDDAENTQYVRQCSRTDNRVAQEDETEDDAQYAQNSGSPTFAFERHNQLYNTHDQSFNTEDDDHDCGDQQRAPQRVADDDDPGDDAQDADEELPAPHLAVYEDTDNRENTADKPVYGQYLDQDEQGRTR